MKGKGQERTTPSPILGRWRITEMELWDQEDLDMEVPAFIEFRPDGMGEFQFILVRGWIDYYLVEREGKAGVEWSWEGSDEMDPCSGRGWAVLERPGRLVGRVFFHRGDDSGFSAEKE